jgi:hypothetical protein
MATYKKFLHQMIGDLAKAFPEDEALQKIASVKDQLRHEDHVAYFRSQLLPQHKDVFLARDESLFDQPMRLIPTVDFSVIWKGASPANKDVMWRYLHTLYILGEQISAPDDLDVGAIQTIVESLQQASGSASDPDTGAGTGMGQMSLDDIIGGGGDDPNPIAGKMKDLVQNIAATFQDTAGSPMEALQDPAQLASLLSNVEAQVKTMCNDEGFNETDLQACAETMKKNLEGKLNLPLDSFAGMMNSGALGALMKNMQQA